MKRPADTSDSDDSDRVARRVRARRSLAANGSRRSTLKAQEEPVEPLPFDGNLPKRVVSDVLSASRPHDTHGYLELKVQMKWSRPGQRIEVSAEQIEQDKKVKFRIEFSGPCRERLVALGQPFDIGDHLCLALRGSLLRQEPKSNMTGRPSYYLEYSEGVLIQYLEKKHPLRTGMRVDTLEGNIGSCAGLQLC